MVNWITTTDNTDNYWITDTDMNTHGKIDRILTFQDFIKIFNNELANKNKPFLKDRKDYLAEIDELFEI